MKVNAQYAASHFDDLSLAVDRAEAVEILRPGKAALHLVSAPSERAKTEWSTPERPRSELFGVLSHLGPLGDDWDSPETNLEIQQSFEDSEIFPKTPLP